MKKLQQFDMIDAIRSYFKLQAFMPIIPWIEKNISMADDVSSEYDKPDFSRYPYQVEILKQWEDLNSRKHVVVMCCEQMGKTSLAVYGILYRLVYKPGSILCCYPSDTKAAEINQAKFIPLLSHIPRNKRRTFETKDDKK